MQPALTPGDHALGTTRSHSKLCTVGLRAAVAAAAAAATGTPDGAWHAPNSAPYHNDRVLKAVVGTIVVVGHAALVALVASRAHD